MLLEPGDRLEVGNALGQVTGTDRLAVLDILGAVVGIDAGARVVGSQRLPRIGAIAVRVAVLPFVEPGHDLVNGRLDVHVQTGKAGVAVPVAEEQTAHLVDADLCHPLIDREHDPGCGGDRPVERGLVDGAVGVVVLNAALPPGVPHGGLVCRFALDAGLTTLADPVGHHQPAVVVRNREGAEDDPGDRHRWHPDHDVGAGRQDDRRLGADRDERAHPARGGGDLAGRAMNVDLVPVGVR